jgi:hypothetical protein
MATNRAKEDRRAEARRSADIAAKHRRAYDDAFQLGRRADEPLAGQHHTEYRRQLLRDGQDMLPSDHPLVGVKASELPGDAIIPMERQLFSALREQAVQPSGDNRADSAWDPAAARVTRDPTTGQTTISYHAKHSFIRELNRPGRVVAALPYSRGAPRAGQAWPGR